MFLALRELRFARGRFALMGLVIALISVLVVLLSGLSVAMMLYDGHGVTQDHAEAARWFRLILEAGDCVISRAMLGNIEETEKARRRAYDGNAESQYRLGTSYRAGWGVPMDLVQAHLWTTLAAAQGHERARSLREIFARSMTSEELTESERLVKQWRQRKLG